MPKEEVADTYALVYYIFLLLGTGLLLPWNVFLTEKEFYDVRLHVAPYYRYITENFMSLFSLVFNTSSMLALSFLVVYQKQMSLRSLVLQPFIIIFVMLVSTAALAIRTDINGEIMGKLSLVSLVLMGVCMAFLQGGIMQLASLFSVTHIRGVVSGIAVGGLVTSTLSLLSQLRIEPTPSLSPSIAKNTFSIHSRLSLASDDPVDDAAKEVAPAAFLYFSTAAAVVGLCIIGYWAIPLLPYGRYKLLLAGILDDTKERILNTYDEDFEEPLLAVVEEEVRVVVDSGADRHGDGSNVGRSNSTSSADKGAHTGSTAMAITNPAVNEGNDASTVARAIIDDVTSTTVVQKRERVFSAIISVERDYTVFTRTWQKRFAFELYCLSLFLTLGVTMTVHPGISAFVCSSSNAATTSPCVVRGGSSSDREIVRRLMGDLFVPLIFVLFSLGDFLGRVLSGHGPWSHRAPKPLSLLFYTLCRSFIAVGICFCHVITPTRWRLHDKLSHDVWPLGLVMSLGFTQGHLISTICMHAPSTLLPTEQSRYGPVTSFSIAVGCCVGSSISTTLSYVMQMH